MANKYQIPAFLGIDEGRSENTLEPGFAPEAWNMDTEGGDLAVGKGFAKHIAVKIPDAYGTIRCMYLWHDAGEDKFVVGAGNKLYRFNGSANPAAWQEIYDFTSTIPTGKTLDGARWDFLESRIGNTDHLIIANGVTRMVKWSGSGTASAFGSGEYVYGESPAASVSALTPAFPKATAAEYREEPDYTMPASASYAKNGTTGTYTLTMSGTYTHTNGATFAFTVPADAEDTLTAVKIAISPNEYTLPYVPQWKAGDLAVFRTDTSTTAGVLQENWKKGTYVLTMPAGYAYSEGQKVAFIAPVVLQTNVRKAYVNDGTNTYELDYVPEWTNGDTAVIQTVSTTGAEILAEDWGYTALTLSSAIPEAWRQWAVDVGLMIAGVTRRITAVDTAGTGITLAEVTEDIKTGDAVKVRGGISDIAVGYIELYYNRLFSAGDAEHPSRLYWSQPPGDTRTIENWSMDDFSETASGGHTEVGPTNNDPIVGLTALSNQLIVHKKSGNYRLIGSNPSNFQILQINSGVESMVNKNRISHGDVPYWLTRAGLYYYNGQQALLHPRSRQMRNTLRNASFANSKGVECRDRLYFTCREGVGSGPDDTVLYYDMVENVWMKRNGFTVIDMASRDGELYLINAARYVYKAGGTSYDGEAIEAYWRTPITDLGAKNIIKKPRKMLLRGRSGSETDETEITAWAGRKPRTSSFILPENDENVHAEKLWNEGMTMHYEIRNKAGSYFKILGGVEVLYEGESYE